MEDYQDKYNRYKWVERMEIKMSNTIGAFLIFSVLTGLVAFIYGGFVDEYNLTPTYVDADGKDIITKLKEVNIIDGINTFIDGVRTVTSGNPVDLLGGLKASATGLIKTLFGVLTAPAEIIGIVTGFYYLPPELAIFLQIFLTVAIAFMIVRYYVGDET